MLPTPLTHDPFTHQHPQTERHINATSMECIVQPPLARLQHSHSHSRLHSGSLGNIHIYSPSHGSLNSRGPRVKSAVLSRQLREKEEEGERVASHRPALVRRKSLSPLPQPSITMDLPSFAPKYPGENSKKRRPLVSHSSFSGLKVKLATPSKSFPLTATVPKSAPTSPNLRSSRKHFLDKNSGPSSALRTSPKTLSPQKTCYSVEDLTRMGKEFAGHTSTSSSNSSSLDIRSPSNGEEQPSPRRDTSPTEKDGRQGDDKDIPEETMPALLATRAEQQPTKTLR